jgi:hypothetical protein
MHTLSSKLPLQQHTIFFSTRENTTDENAREKPNERPLFGASKDEDSCYYIHWLPREIWRTLLDAKCTSVERLSLPEYWDWRSKSLSQKSLLWPYFVRLVDCLCENLRERRLVCHKICGTRAYYNLLPRYVPAHVHRHFRQSNGRRGHPYDVNAMTRLHKLPQQCSCVQLRAASDHPMWTGLE